MEQNESLENKLSPTHNNEVSAPSVARNQNSLLTGCSAKSGEMEEDIVL
jgi:hypothetical protein